MQYFVVLFALLLASVSLSAQSATPPPVQDLASAPVWPPSKNIGVFVFGKNGQTPEQQLKDDSDCYGAAKQQSGIDSRAPAPTRKTIIQKVVEQETAASSAVDDWEYIVTLEMLCDDERH